MVTPTSSTVCREAPSDDVWAVGGTLGGTGMPPLTLHWSGASWSVVPGSYTPGRVYALLDVKANAPNDVWAVGQWFTTDYLENGPAAEHWDGTAWKVTPLRFPGTSGGFYGIGASSSTDVWAVGFYYDASFDVHPLAEYSRGPCTAKVPGRSTQPPWYAGAPAYRAEGVVIRPPPGSTPPVNRRSISSRTLVLGATLLMAWASFRSTCSHPKLKLRPLRVYRNPRTSPQNPQCNRTTMIRSRPEVVNQMLPSGPVVMP